MSVSIEPDPVDSAGLAPGLTRELPVPPDFPARPVPADMSRQARRQAVRIRAVRAVAVLAACATVTAGAMAAWRASTGPIGVALPTLPVEPPTVNPYPAEVELPRTGVGIGASAWVELSGWCVGDISVRGGTGTVDSCRFLPVSGKLDVALLEPGHYAPAGYSLVVVVAVVPTGPFETVRGILTDGSGTGDLTVDRAAGLPDVVFLWGFTRGGPISVRVTDTQGRPYASCESCAGPAK